MSNSAFDNLEVAFIPSFDLDSVGGGSVQDFSTKGRNGTLANGAAFTEQNRSYALAFDGVNDRVDVANFTIGQDWSFAAWIFHDGGTTSYQSILTDSGGTIGILLRGVGAPNAGKVNLFNGALNFHSNGTIPASTWTHIAVRCTGGNGTFYINGAASGTFAGWGSTGAKDWKIGATSASGYPFDGKLDDWLLWSRQITTTELSFIYKRTNGEPERGQLLFTEKRPRIVEVGSSQPSADVQIGDLIQVLILKDSSAPSGITGYSTRQDGVGDAASPYYKIQELIVTAVPLDDFVPAPLHTYRFWQIRRAQIGVNAAWRGNQTVIKSSTGTNAWSPMAMDTAGGKCFTHIRVAAVKASGTLGADSNGDGYVLRWSSTTLKIWELIPSLKTGGSNFAGEHQIAVSGSDAVWQITFGYWESDQIEGYASEIEVLGDTSSAALPRLLAVQETVETVGRSVSFTPFTIVAGAEAVEVVGVPPFVALISSSSMVIESLGDTSAAALPAIVAFHTSVETVGRSVAFTPFTVAAAAEEIEVLGTPPGPVRLQASASEIEVLGDTSAAALNLLIASSVVVETAGRSVAFTPFTIVAGAEAIEVLGDSESVALVKLVAKAAAVEALGDTVPGGVQYLRGQSAAIEVLGVQVLSAARRDFEELFLSPWDSTRWQTTE